MNDSLLDRDSYQRFLVKINAINPDSQPQWGKMSAAQMFAHCADVQETYNGLQPWGKISLLARLLKGQIKKLVLGDRPYQKNLPTLPQFKQTEHKDFTIEKDRLLKQLELFHIRDAEVIKEFKHPLWGNLTLNERDRITSKHLIHHLKQFGV